MAPHAITPVIEILFFTVGQLGLPQVTLRIKNEDVADALASAAIVACEKVAVHVAGEANR